MKLCARKIIGSNKVALAIFCLKLLLNVLTTRQGVTWNTLEVGKQEQMRVSPNGYLQRQKPELSYHQLISLSIDFLKITSGHLFGQILSPDLMSDTIFRTVASRKISSVHSKFPLTQQQMLVIQISMDQKTSPKVLELQ